MSNMKHSLSSNKQTFEYFKNQIVDGVTGVVRIDSGKLGPVLGITACTHGNEPAGLAIFAHLLEELDIRNTIKYGTLYLVINNLAAAKKYFDLSDSDDKSCSRFLDINMNRLPKDVLTNESDERSEAKRARELRQIWKRFDYGIDIHSTESDIEPMIISKGGIFRQDLIRGFPIEKLISNIDRVQIGVPAYSFYGDANSSVFAIESGQHEKDATFVRAATCAESLLQNLHMLDGEPSVRIDAYREFFIDASVVFIDMSYDFVKNFTEEEMVSKGQVLAVSSNGLTDITAPFDGALIMPSTKRGAVKNINEEQAFISMPVHMRHIN